MNESDASDDDMPCSRLVSTATPTEGKAAEHEQPISFDGEKLSKKRRLELTDEESDRLYERMSELISNLSRRVKTLESALQAVKDVAEHAAPTPRVASDETSGGQQTGVSVDADRRLPFVLSPQHPHSYLNRIKLKVVTWVDPPPKLESGAIISSPNELDFPHRVRWENNGIPPTLWVETFPRRMTLVATMQIKIGSDDLIDCNDPATILYHANKMLSPQMPKETELKFVAYLVYGDANNGYDKQCRPTTSSKKPLFKHPEACLHLYNGEYIPAFFHTNSQKKPTSVHTTGILRDGRIVFKNICFSQQALSSCVTTHGDGSWRLCIRSSHPALSRMLNFSVLTPVFFTGRRVRSVRAKGGDDAASDDS